MPPPDVAAAIRVWNLMGGEVRIDDALAACADLVGVRDLEVLTEQLMTIRTHLREKR